ncbi:5188_t:CDS:2, partial [Acaulospora colombiana]
MSTKTERSTTAVTKPTDDLNLRANGRLAGASLDILSISKGPTEPGEVKAKLTTALRSIDCVLRLPQVTGITLLESFSARKSDH